MAALPELESPVVAALDAVYGRLREQETRRGYLGASMIGHECARAVWLEFRWAGAAEEFEGRILRLFDTGHRAEDRMVRDLRAAGMVVRAVDPETDAQYEIAFANGHGGGHTDGEVEGVPGAEKTVHLLECKTHNAKSFEQLQKFKVKIAKPRHYAQMQIYMHKRGLKRALYLALNKDTDRYYAERVEYDAPFALALEAKGETLVNQHVPPGKISDDPTSYSCRFCSKWDVCHGATWPARNCRTCLHSSPVAGGKWHCERHDIELSRQDQERGCVFHRYLPGLVPGEQIDAASDLLTVAYKLRDGEVWIDTGARA